MRIRTEAGVSPEGLVRVAPGLALPRQMTVTAEDLNGFDVEVSVEPLEGRLVATEVRVTQRKGGPVVTGEALRSIPVARLTQQAAQHLLTYQEKDGDIEWGPPTLTPDKAVKIREAGPVADSLEWVAYIYRMALLMGESPTRAVEVTLGLPRSTAGRWVASARDKGFLGPAETQGKAGG